MARHVRRCSRTGCPDSAVATLTYVYSDSTAVVGPLATVSEPHSWDLCVSHAGRITAPRGWELVRHAGPLPTHPDEDDLIALAEAVREGREAPVSGMAAGFTDPVTGVPSAVVTDAFSTTAWPNVVGFAVGDVSVVVVVR